MKLPLIIFFIISFSGAVNATNQTKKEIIHEAATSLAKDTMKAMENEARIQAFNDRAILTPGSQQGHDLKMAISVSVGETVDLPLALFIAKCADLAAHPDDPQKYGSGVEFSKLNALRGLRRCEYAYKNGGGRFGLVTSSLSRIYNKMKDYRQSIKYARETVKLGYAYGDLLMGVHYQFGEGVKKNLTTSTEWYIKAANKGISVSMRLLSENYVEGNGAEIDLDKSLYWALKAANTNEKAFYNLGVVLEKMANAKPNARQYYQISKQAFEIAGANSVSVKREIARINKKMNPNGIAKTSVLSAPTVKGQMIGGVFISDETDSKWYMGGKSLKEKTGVHIYARVSYQNSVFTVWYKDSKSNDDGWYIDFYYAGKSKITEFKHVSVSSLDSSFAKIGTPSLRLDASDLKVEELAGGYRLTAKITYRDIISLQNGEVVSIHFKAKGSSYPSYRMRLNWDEREPNQYAKQVLTELASEAKKLQPYCCQRPKISPLTKQYFILYNECKNEGFDHSLRKQRIRQNCHHFLKNAKSFDDAIMSNRLDRSITQFLQEIDKLRSQ